MLAGSPRQVAPRQSTLGVMLAYTPLHHLLLGDAGIPLVMTSGNNSDEPIAYRDEEAFEQIGEIADYFLVHDRPIHMRTDDSVVRVAGGETYPIRRSRGYAPAPLAVAEDFGRHVLACGGELKNTFCVAKERHVFLSHHIGDLENYETLTFLPGRSRALLPALRRAAGSSWPTTCTPSISLPNTPASWRRRGFPPWAYSTTTRTSRVAWRTTSAGRRARHRGCAGRDRIRDRRGRLGRRVLRGERGGRVRAAGTPGVRPHARWIGGHPPAVADGARATRRALR